MSFVRVKNYFEIESCGAPPLALINDLARSGESAGTCLYSSDILS